MQLQEEEELDAATKRQIFISLLEEKDVNPFNTWENEMPKIVQDPRYAMLRNTKQRMEIFGEWARARIALIKEEKAQEMKEDVFPPFTFSPSLPPLFFSPLPLLCLLLIFSLQLLDVG